MAVSIVEGRGENVRDGVTQDAPVGGVERKIVELPFPEAAPTDAMDVGWEREDIADGVCFFRIWRKGGIFGGLDIITSTFFAFVVLIQVRKTVFQFFSSRK